jgi:hypothetical protein
MNDDLEEFERLFDLPDEFDALKKKIDQLQAAINNNGAGTLRLTVFQAMESAAENYLNSAKLSASIMDRAREAMDKSARQTIVRRRWIWGLGIAAALLLTAVSGLAAGHSPDLTAAVLKTEIGCDLHGGRWIAEAAACAFEARPQR